MIASLKIIFTVLLIRMIYVVICTSLESNLFTEWDFLGSIPWMRATLWDFYTNALIIYLWIFYKESSIFLKILWLLLMFFLGSIASCVYILIELFRLKPGEGLTDLFVKKHA
ncbi:DUF1475 family protein [Dyadobacter frigoris]|uniref:DUF1475 domain-containing protein n=1 Tax=Dyadobacter frigoris TaxID=2576211 RepID=A0A4U6CS93_9BACT|nr:DUF1475 family protein [Dyadobacter frigoris]TKT87470.1 DUF1475 domain-containing protein [Dyadobacter frigoris]GLU52278.1 hypothetical protein Dfri01_17390 [Dyadobacter frigoris]